MKFNKVIQNKIEFINFNVFRKSKHCIIFTTIEIKS